MRMIQIIGRTGQDVPEPKFTSSGTEVVSVNIAADSGWGDNKTTVWYKATFWGKRASTVHQNLGKGSLIFVQGIPNVETWEDKQGVTKTSQVIQVNDFNFLDVKPPPARKASISEEAFPFQDNSPTVPSEGTVDLNQFL